MLIVAIVTLAVIVVVDYEDGDVVVVAVDDGDGDVVVDDGDIVVRVVDSSGESKLIKFPLALGGFWLPVLSADRT